MFPGRGPGITNDEVPKHSPSSSPRASCPYCVGPTPMNLAAESMSLEMALVWKPWLEISEIRGREAARLMRLSSVSQVVSAPL